MHPSHAVMRACELRRLEFLQAAAHERLVEEAYQAVQAEQRAQQEHAPFRTPGRAVILARLLMSRLFGGSPALGGRSPEVS